MAKAVTTTTEKQDRFGNKVKDKEITRVKVTQEDLKTLRKAVTAAIAFAEEPEGWFVLLGSSFSGKTHLAAAIGNYRIDLGGQALLVEVADLLDYMRQTFRPTSDVSFDRRFNEIKTTPMLILDDLKEMSICGCKCTGNLRQHCTSSFRQRCTTFSGVQWMVAAAEK